ncbi:hypothetical protein CEXT_288291 [Caerostris extrusa]|uniref:Uncharacterized protein n=1 Tax=Caerostris extrusa TaxID=172846 RepID=A0AAV4MP64_CAEEX|nr:hypothetical protein CEXT_288291 [Caerostris extrusa]
MSMTNSAPFGHASKQNLEQFSNKTKLIGDDMSFTCFNFVSCSSTADKKFEEICNKTKLTVHDMEETCIADNDLQEKGSSISSNALLDINAISEPATEKTRENLSEAKSILSLTTLN